MKDKENAVKWSALTDVDRLGALKALEIAHEDFVRGYNRLNAMSKLDKSEWIVNNREYYRNCASAVKYMFQQITRSKHKEVK